MSIKSEIDAIRVEVESIEESKGRIRKYARELNKLNPLVVGHEYIVNGYSHHGKTIVAESVYVSDSRGANVELSAREAVFFTAYGRVKKKDGDLGVCRGIHNVKITVLI